MHIHRVFIISLDRDRKRREQLLADLSGFTGWRPEVISGVDGRTLPDIVCLALTDNPGWVSRKGTIGCFLSHVSAWERIAAISEPFALVLEDDATVFELDRIHTLDIPTDAEIVFLHDKLKPAIHYDDDGTHIEPIQHGLTTLEPLNIGPGAYGYLLSSAGAEKLLNACRKDLFYGHVDGRLLRYAIAETDLINLDPNGTLHAVITKHHDRSRMPEMGLLKSYSISPPLIGHRNLDSVRDIFDAGETQNEQ